MLPQAKKWLEDQPKIKTTFVESKKKLDAVDIKHVQDKIKAQPTKAFNPTAAKVNATQTKTTTKKKIVVRRGKDGRLHKVVVMVNEPVNQPVKPQTQPTQQLSNQQLGNQISQRNQMLNSIAQRQQTSQQQAPPLWAQPKQDNGSPSLQAVRLHQSMRTWSNAQWQQVIREMTGEQRAAFYEVFSKIDNNALDSLFNRLSTQTKTQLFAIFNLEQQKTIYNKLSTYTKREIYERLSTTQRTELDTAQASGRQLLPSALDALSNSRSGPYNNNRNMYDRGSSNYDRSYSYNNQVNLAELSRRNQEDYNARLKTETARLEKQRKDEIEKLQQQQKLKDEANQKRMKELEQKMQQQQKPPDEKAILAEKLKVVPKKAPSIVPASGTKKTVQLLKKVGEMQSGVPKKEREEKRALEIKENLTLDKLQEAVPNAKKLNELLGDGAQFLELLETVTDRTYEQVFGTKIVPFNMVGEDPSEVIKKMLSAIENEIKIENMQEEKDQNKLSAWLKMCKLLEKLKTNARIIREQISKEDNIISLIGKGAAKQETIRQTVENYIATGQLDNALNAVNELNEVYNTIKGSAADTINTVSDKERQVALSNSVKELMSRLDADIKRLRDNIYSKEKEEKEKYRTQVETIKEQGTKDLEDIKTLMSERIEIFNEDTSVTSFHNYINSALDFYNKHLKVLETDPSETTEIKKIGVQKIIGYIEKVRSEWNNALMLYASYTINKAMKEITKICG